MRYIPYTIQYLRDSPEIPFWPYLEIFQTKVYFFFISFFVHFKHPIEIIFWNFVLFDVYRHLLPFLRTLFLGGYDRPGSRNEFNIPGLPCFEIRSTIPTARCCMNTVLESHRKWTVKFGIPRSALRFFHLAISVH